MTREVKQPGIQSQLTPSELRRFGISLGLLLGFFLGLFLPFLFSYAFAVWPWIITLILSTLAVIKPTFLTRVHHYWFGLGQWLNRFTSPILLGIIFFGLVLPIGLTKRLFRASKLKLGFESNLKTYRESILTSDDTRDPF